MVKHWSSFHYVLIFGDLVALAMVTLYGFAAHDRLGVAGGRMFTTFAPLVAAWLLVAPHLGVFEQKLAGEARHLWRPFWAMVLAAPLAAWLRGLWLQTPIMPTFVAVLGGVCAAALLAWRSLVWLYLAFITRNKHIYG